MCDRFTHGRAKAKTVKAFAWGTVKKSISYVKSAVLLKNVFSGQMRMISREWSHTKWRTTDQICNKLWNCAIPSMSMIVGVIDLIFF